MGNISLLEDDWYEREKQSPFPYHVPDISALTAVAVMSANPVGKGTSQILER